MVAVELGSEPSGSLTTDSFTFPSPSQLKFLLYFNTLSQFWEQGNFCGSPNYYLKADKQSGNLVEAKEIFSIAITVVQEEKLENRQ